MIDFTAEFLKKLEMLSLVSKKVFAGKIKGERRSSKRGQSVEFADYRNYVQGDDHRHIDWNAYARLENLFLKLFIEEEDLLIYLLVDASKSMDFGKKFETALQTAAALAYIGLANLDRVGIAAFGAETVRLPVQHGKQNIFKVLEFLKGLKAGGAADLTKTVEEFVRLNPRKGLVVVASDFLDPAGYEDALKRLRFNKYEPIAIHILSPEEMNPEPGGDWNLIDAETGARVEMSLGSRALKAYQARLQAFLAGLESCCRSLDIAYVRAITNQPFEELVLKYFRSAALLA